MLFGILAIVFIVIVPILDCFGGGEMETKKMLFDMFLGVVFMGLSYLTAPWMWRY